MTTADQFFAGTSNLVLPVPNKQALPETFRNKPRLTYYATLFNSLEVNSSFYKVPKPSTFAKWVYEVPEEFRFSIKLWRGITHIPSLHFRMKDVVQFMEAANCLASKKGCLLVQLPPGTRSDKSAYLERLLDCISRNNPNRDWNIAVEFRHSSWYSEKTVGMLRQYGAAWVIQDMPDSMMRDSMQEAPFVYLRYHGPAGDYKGSYPDDKLDHDADRIIAWLNHGKPVYAYFNNTIGDALNNVLTLKEMVFQSFPL
ncbi:MAG TPA: DUF72 domain-containing protein [Puia sp.]|nr:DUF72 domain-containing protein [Puia sp.]